MKLELHVFFHGDSDVLQQLTELKGDIKIMSEKLTEDLATLTALATDMNAKLDIVKSIDVDQTNAIEALKAQIVVLQNTEADTTETEAALEEVIATLQGANAKVTDLAATPPVVTEA